MVGGAGGLGRAVVEALRPHHRLAILDLDEAALARAREQLTDDGDAPQLLVCDVTDPVSIASAFRRVEAALGPVSVLVNVVGIPPTHASAAAIDLEVARRAWDVNVLGAWACMQAVIPGMAAMGWGRIVNVTSVSAVDGWRQRSEYAGSKAALASLTMTTAVEVAADGITVNAVAPGHMRTPMTEPLGGGRIDWSSIIDRIPLGRLVTPREVAAAVAFLASDAASGITGVQLAVDGGYLINRYV